MRRHVTRLIPLAVALLTAAGLSSATTGAASAADCGISPLLVPGCGAWWGISTSPATHAQLVSLEAQVGRQFDTVYDFHTVGDTLPTPDEITDVNEGRMLHVNIESRGYTWPQVAAGAADVKLRSQAAGLAALGHPVFVNFDHEPDAAAKYNVKGAAADFVTAFRHVHDVFVAAGATNAIWVWVTTGWKSNFYKYPGLYPGNDVVDWISWEAYTGVNCPSSPTLSSTASFANNVTPMYNWLHTTGAANGIDPNKPYMISEYDAVYNTPDPAVTGNWYRGIPAALSAQFPQIKAVQKWDVAGGNCRYSMTTDPAVLAGMADAGHDPFVNQPHQ